MGTPRHSGPQGRTVHHSRLSTSSRKRTTPQASKATPGPSGNDLSISELRFLVGDGLEEVLDLASIFAHSDPAIWRLPLLFYLLSNESTPRSHVIHEYFDPFLRGPLQCDQFVLLEGYTKAFGPISSKPQQGLLTLLDFIKNDDKIRDVRWAAYMLATVKHECADTWHPIPEYGQGKNHEYGKPVTVECQGKNADRVYYGRGYVQLTWYGNYKTMGDLLKQDLICHPELALDPAIAYAIMSSGMRTGVAYANGHKLSDYISGARADYINARRIINGLDQAQLIAGYARKLELILLLSLLHH